MCVKFCNNSWLPPVKVPFCCLLSWVRSFGTDSTPGVNPGWTFRGEGYLPIDLRKPYVRESAFFALDDPGYLVENKAPPGCPKRAAPKPFALGLQFLPGSCLSDRVGSSQSGRRMTS